MRGTRLANTLPEGYHVLIAHLLGIRCSSILVAPLRAMRPAHLEKWHSEDSTSHRNAHNEYRFIVTATDSHQDRHAGADDRVKLY